jgi:hypothetical protein
VTEPRTIPWQRVGEWLALANAAGLLVWLGVFMNWVIPTFGFFDIELIGTSTLAWPFLIVAASALALFGADRGLTRALAWVAVLLIGVVLVDETIGALRDGNVSAYGLRLGALMGVQLVIAIGSAFASQRGAPAGRRAAR